MQKWAIALGIPAVVAIGILIREYPEYWWVALVVPLALVRYLMRRTLTERPLLPKSKDPEFTDQSHTASSSREEDRSRLP
jgi:hypothetical protein